MKINARSTGARSLVTTKSQSQAARDLVRCRFRPSARIGHLLRSQGDGNASWKEPAFHPAWSRFRRSGRRTVRDRGAGGARTRRHPRIGLVVKWLSIADYQGYRIFCSTIYAASVTATHLTGPIAIVGA